MSNYNTPVLGVVAASGTGKTTLLVALIPVLKRRGIRVGLIKHTHHDFQIDQPGKDSFRLREAGADSVMLVSGFRKAIISEMNPIREPSLVEVLRQFDQGEFDFILVEGFKSESIPKLELHRKDMAQGLLYPHDLAIIAVASDEPLVLPVPLSCLDINQPEKIADFIIMHFSLTP